jgi:hypothetical protein
MSLAGRYILNVALCHSSITANWSPISLKPYGVFVCSPSGRHQLGARRVRLRMLNLKHASLRACRCYRNDGPPLSLPDLQDDLRNRSSPRSTAGRANLRDLPASPGHACSRSLIRRGTSEMPQCGPACRHSSCRYQFFAVAFRRLSGPPRLVTWRLTISVVR